MLAAMDPKLWLSTFFAVFLAELGDKTQLATFSVAASNNASKLGVFTASASALVLSSALAVLVGGLIAEHVSPVWMKRAAGAVFIVMGALYLWQSFAKPEPPAASADAPAEKEASSSDSGAKDDGPQGRT